MMSRRHLAAGLGAFGALLGGSALFLLRPGDGTAAPPHPSRRFEVERTDAEWRRLLTPAQYAVLRGHGTERAGSSPLNAEKRRGSYACTGCALPLFSSDAKYD